MIDHVALYVTDLNRSRRFYEQALEPLGYGVVLKWKGS
jgi:catechol 2,3-dioxygenase-like lactoylglutathione lyase family enzyme